MKTMMKKIFLILVAAIMLVSCNSKPTLADLGIPEYELHLMYMDMISNSDTTYMCFLIEHHRMEDTTAYMELCQVDSLEVIFWDPEDSSIVTSYKAPFRLQNPELRYVEIGSCRLDNQYCRDSYDWIAVPNNVADTGVYILEVKALKCEPVYEEVEVGKNFIFYTKIERRHM